MKDTTSSDTIDEGAVTEKREKLLIFQIGSLGDTVISMPCYRAIQERHPHADRFLLTNFPKNRKMVQAEALLAPCGLVQGAVEYPMPLRGFGNMVRLWRSLRALKVDVLYYLVPEKSFSNLVRHYIFLKLCGIRKIRTVPWSRDLRYPRELVCGELWESEASRLLRTLDPRRIPAAPDPAKRQLDLTEAEKDAATRLLAEMPGTENFIAVSVGGKVLLNNWGDKNWSAVLRDLSATDLSMGLVLVGSADERERNNRLAEQWSGPKINSCGRLTPRETAAVLERAQMFLGHDTGTLHLAAAVDTRILGVYSARNNPGKWFSDRSGDKFFYHKPPCFGCELEKPESCPHGLVCMTAHQSDEVVRTAQNLLAATRKPMLPVEAEPSL